MTIKTRKLGRSGIEVSAVGLGCWAIGGPLWYIVDNTRHPLSYGEIDDREAIQAIRRALDLGVNFFDTADAYGCGHSERILGQAIEGQREEVIIATKFGNIYDESSRTWLGNPDKMTPDYIRESCEGSLKRLNTDYIDLYQCHCKEYDTKLVADLLLVLEDLINEGKIRYYGWSTPYLKQARTFVEGSHCTAIQYNYNLLERNPEMLALCQEYSQASIARGPYAMGLLTGKYNRDSKIPEDDLRNPWWDLQQGRQAKQLEMLESIREILTRDGRTLVQAALGWLWALDSQIVPIPGFKNVRQVEETVGALEFGPLSKKQMQEIEQILEPYFENLIHVD